MKPKPETIPEEPVVGTELVRKMSKETSDPDSTMALLSSELPSIKCSAKGPAVPNYPAPDDDSEDEVFFGERSDREKYGPNSKFIRRPTIDPNELERVQRRSWMIGSRLKESEKNSCRESLLGVENIIDEEEERETKIHENQENKSPNVKFVRYLPLKSKEPKEELSDSFSNLTMDSEPRSRRGASFDCSTGNKEFNEITQVEETLATEDQEESKVESDCLNASNVSSLNSSAASNWFDNTHDEMVLFERFGEKYDEVVAKMSLEERKVLKKEVRNAVPKSAEELLGKEALSDDEIPIIKTPEIHRFVIDKPYSPQLTPKKNGTTDLTKLQPPTPKPRTMTPQKLKEIEKAEEKKHIEKEFSPRRVECPNALQMLKDELAIALRESDDGENAQKKAPTRETFEDDTEEEEMANPLCLSSLKPQTKRSPKTSPKTPSRAPPKTPSGFSPKPVVSSKLPTPCVGGNRHKTPTKQVLEKMKEGSQKTPSATKTPLKPMAKSPATFKTPRNIYSSKSKNINTPSYLRPTSASKFRASPRKDPRTNETLDVTICNRHGYAYTESPALPNTKTSSKKIPGNIDMNKIVSPIAQYIKDDPAPPLIRQIKPSKHRQIDREIISTVASERPIESVTPAKTTYSPLPEAVYKSSAVVLETEMNEEKRKKHYAYPIRDNVEAMVVRHVAREPVPAHLRKEEDFKVGMGGPVPVSMSNNQHSQKACIKMSAANDSIGSCNDSHMEMSIREIKKVTLGRHHQY